MKKFIQGEKFEEEDKNEKYMSFEATEDAKNFQLKIESYSEVDFFMQEQKLRHYITELIEPIIKRGNQDRENIFEFNNRFANFTKRIQLLEDIIFQRTDFDKLAIFEKLFAAIKKVDQKRIEKEGELLKQMQMI
jgi:hypothetical protein